MAEMEKKFQELKNRLAEIYDLDMINSLLNWDQSTYMPAGGAEARGRKTTREGEQVCQGATPQKCGANSWRVWIGEPRDVKTGRGGTTVDSGRRLFGHAGRIAACVFRRGRR